MESSDFIKKREQACLTLLQATKTDNEKLAALLLVPKLFSTSLNECEADDEETKNSSQSEKDSGGSAKSSGASSKDSAGSMSIDKQFQRELIAAIDFQFLKRMLSVSDAADNSASENAASLLNDSISLKLAALSVIQCFTETEVLAEQQISVVISSIESLVGLVSTVGEKVDAGDSEGSQCTHQSYKQLSDLCLQCLENFARDQDNKVVETILLPAVYRLVMKQSSRGLYTAVTHCILITNTWNIL